MNRAVAIAYPKLRAKYGSSVRYDHAMTAHLNTEFGFDTPEVAKNRYASDQSERDRRYRNFLFAKLGVWRIRSYLCVWNATLVICGMSRRYRSLLEEERTNALVLPRPRPRSR